jgi:uncharacterized protein (TIRG00374 family)
MLAEIPKNTRLDERPPGPLSESAPRVAKVRRGHRLAIYVLGTVVFAVSAWHIGRSFQWRELAQILRRVNLSCLVLYGGASIIVYWMLRALRWHVLLKRTGTTVPLFDLYMCTAVSLSFALFTPLQSGEMLKIELLKKYGMIRRSPGYGSFFVERAVDLAVVLAMACLSMFTTVNILSSRTCACVFLLIFFLMCVAGVLVLNRLELKGRAKRLRDHIQECVFDVPTLLSVVAISIVSWSMVAYSWKIFLFSGSVDVSFPQSIALTSIVVLIGILSLIPGGLGASEAGTSQLLMRFGFSPALAQAGSLVLRSYWIVALALGLIHLGLWKLARIYRSRRSAAADVLAVVATPAGRIG